MKTMALMVALAATPAWAESNSPGTARPTTAYRSVFADYKPLQDEALHDWRRVNDEMGRLRGHMGHLEVTQTKAAPTHEHAKPPTPPSDDRR